MENIVKENKIKLFALSFASLAMALASFFIFIYGYEAIATIGILFFGAGFVIIIKKALKPSTLKFTAEGIEWKDYSGTSFIQKNNIEKIGIHTMKIAGNTSRFFGIRLKDIDKYISNIRGEKTIELKTVESTMSKMYVMKNPTQKDWILKSREMSGYDIAFPLTTFNEEKLLKLAKEFFPDKL